MVCIWRHALLILVNAIDFAWLSTVTVNVYFRVRNYGTPTILITYKFHIEIIVLHFNVDRQQTITAAYPCEDGTQWFLIRDSPPHPCQQTRLMHLDYAVNFTDKIMCLWDTICLGRKKVSPLPNLESGESSHHDDNRSDNWGHQLDRRSL